MIVCLRRLNIVIGGGPAGSGLGVRYGGAHDALKYIKYRLERWDVITTTINYVKLGGSTK